MVSGVSADLHMIEESAWLDSIPGFSKHALYGGAWRTYMQKSEKEQQDEHVHASKQVSWPAANRDGQIDMNLLSAVERVLEREGRSKECSGGM